MYPADLAAFIGGLIAMGYIVIGLLFLRAWRRTRDPIFMSFAVAFWLLAVNQAAFPLTGATQRETGWLYLIRLAAFALIIFTIVARNLSGSGGAARHDRRRGGAPADADPRSCD
jgi:hypothetical protein